MCHWTRAGPGPSYGGHYGHQVLFLGLDPSHSPASGTSPPAHVLALLTSSTSGSGEAEHRPSHTQEQPAKLLAWLFWGWDKIMDFCSAFPHVILTFQWLGCQLSGKSKALEGTRRCEPTGLFGLAPSSWGLCLPHAPRFQAQELPARCSPPAPSPSPPQHPPLPRPRRGLQKTRQRWGLFAPKQIS